MAANNGVLETLDRKAQIAGATPQRHSTLRQAADNLSRRAIDAAVVELFNEALARLLLLCYETDAGGLCNVDAITGRILIPLPFGRNGAAQWGLRPQEANILRQILFDWQENGLFLYDRSRRAWFINLAQFPGPAPAKSWLRAHQIGVALYRSARAKRVSNT